MSVECDVSIICMVRYTCCVLYLWHSLQLKRRPLLRISACPMFLMSAPQPDRCSQCALPFNMLRHRFHHILLTSCEQLFTPARKVYNRDPVAEYTSIQTTAHASHYYTRNQIAERGTPSLLEATSRVYRCSPDAANIFAIATFWRLSPI